jgi:exoribonuclease-2
MQAENGKPLLTTNSLLLYKNHPARLARIGDRLEIELEGGETARVRPKDVEILHPGPLNSLSELRPVRGDVQAAWEILAGGLTNLAELAELCYGAFSPVTAWAAWQQVAEGVYFEGSPENIRVRTVEEVARRRREREQAEANQQARAAFLDRLRKGKIILEDREFLREVENLALQSSGLQGSWRSPLLRELGRSETPDSAYALLLELGVWNEMTNPYPVRLGLPLNQPNLAVPDLLEEERRDLTHLAAFAIDDEDTDTPDDAISLEETIQGWRLWVHVADVAALVPPDSPMDLEARGRGESLHLPEGTIHLLPREVTVQLGLGMQAITPALSFGIDLEETGRVTGFIVVPSRVRVTRLTYEAAEQIIDSDPFRGLERLMRAHRARRRANGAVMIDFPEVKMGIENGRVKIRPVAPLRSRAIVEEAMILTGAEAARFAAENDLHLAFSQQDPPDEPLGIPETRAQMFATRRLLKRSRYKTTPGPHSGLGVPAYTQVTSPLRRYLDLVGHQQLRAFLSGAPRLDEGALLERIGSTEAVVGSVRLGEALSEKHWTLVYLLQHPDWRGEGILVDSRGQYGGRGASGTVLIPSLALEARVHLSGDVPLDGIVTLDLGGVSLPQREASFRIEKNG